jgi:hypothetical protein
MEKPMAETLFTSTSQAVSRCEFGEMNLQVGDRLEFQLTPTALHPRLITHLIGYEPGQSVLMRTPFQNNLPVNVHEGAEVVIRAFSGTKAFAFLSQVQRMCIAPFLYLHLAYPNEIQYLEIRKNERLPLRLLAETRVKGTWRPAMLLDLGMGGSMVESAHHLGQPGDVVELRISFPVEPMLGEVQITAAAAIQHVEPHHGADGLPTYHHGVEFRDLSKGDSVMLQNFLFRLLLDAHGTGV